jgi:hypothetical protein
MTFRERHRLRTFRKRMLRIFGPVTDEVIAGWGKLHNDELHDMFSSSSIIIMAK